MRAAASDISLAAVTWPKDTPGTEGASAICRALGGRGGPVLMPHRGRPITVGDH
jgi:hypothetical protein